MFYEILDAKRIAMLPLFKKFKDRFYLAGGTSLALQIGHRDSIDFDFFCQEDIDTKKLFEQLREIFAGHTIVKTQEEPNTLTIIIDESIKVSFFSYKYKRIRNTVDDEHITLASIEDIACMKLSAITGRATNKDYIDLYFILKQFSLQDILDYANEKYSELDTNLVLKSLIYFDDITEEDILYQNNKEVPFEDIKNSLRKNVKELMVPT